MDVMVERRQADPPYIELNNTLSPNVAKVYVCVSRCACLCCGVKGSLTRTFSHIRSSLVQYMACNKFRHLLQSRRKERVELVTQTDRPTNKAESPSPVFFLFPVCIYLRPAIFSLPLFLLFSSFFLFFFLYSNSTYSSSFFSPFTFIHSNSFQPWPPTLLPTRKSSTSSTSTVPTSKFIHLPFAIYCKHGQQRSRYPIKASLHQSHVYPVSDQKSFFTSIYLLATTPSPSSSPRPRVSGSGTAR